VSNGIHVSTTGIHVNSRKEYYYLLDSEVLTHKKHRSTEASNITVGSSLFYHCIASFAATWNMSLFGDLIKGLGVTFGCPQPIPTSALKPCLKGSANCIRTTWVSGGSKEEATEAIQKCLAAYPQKGQNGVDKGGWTIAEGSLESGSARLEFLSGTGPRSFVDDLLMEVQEDGRVEVRSSSRIGYSDMGVNQTRLRHLAGALPKTWNVPDPGYRIRKKERVLQKNKE
jgi:hypothetical protein